MRATTINRAARLLAESWIARDKANAILVTLTGAEEYDAHARAHELHAMAMRKSHGKNLLTKHADGE